MAASVAPASDAERERVFADVYEWRDRTARGVDEAPGATAVALRAVSGACAYCQRTQTTFCLVTRSRRLRGSAPPQWACSLACARRCPALSPPLRKSSWV